MTDVYPQLLTRKIDIFSDQYIEAWQHVVARSENLRDWQDRIKRTLPHRNKWQTQNKVNSVSENYWSESVFFNAFSTFFVRIQLNTRGVKARVMVFYFHLLDICHFISMKLSSTVIVAWAKIKIVIDLHSLHKSLRSSQLKSSIGMYKPCRPERKMDVFCIGR